jgi:cobyrinic acid a,c-diamide synthase
MSLIIAAPSSGSGKTTITLGILRALAQRGTPIRAAKSGPDYIDPQFHAAACGNPCINLDAWAMPADTIKQLAQDPLIIEGAMGLFDGAPPAGKGSTADLARILELPVILVVDASAMAQSIAPLVKGFATHDPHVQIAGVILNRVGSERHARMLRTALAPTNIPVIGCVMRNAALARPSRHLGLVQPSEMPDLEGFLNAAAEIMTQSIDLDALLAHGRPLPAHASQIAKADHPKTIAIARDAAFAFRYAQDDAQLIAQGHTLKYFSPLANDPVPVADHIILPGGYPELHAQTIANAHRFMGTLREAARLKPISGECGGYMVLGETLTDADGTAHDMAGLLGLATSFETRKLHLGYRTLKRAGQPDLKGHEFHYATTLMAAGTPLYDAYDAENTPLGPMGLIEGNVSGSFAHIIGTD